MHGVLRPRADDTIEVNPLAPEGWDYFCLDHIAYHGRTLTICWDRTGQRYGKGKGLRVFADGKQIAAAEKLARQPPGAIEVRIEDLGGDRRRLTIEVP